jgi:cleavage and polyadenylation specificity factor subunit 1
VWRGLSSDVTAWARRCLACQRGKIHRHTRLAPLPIPIPQQRFSHLHVDLVGPLQYSNNFNYIFTIIDRTSRWMEAIPLSNTSPGACAKALTYTRISRFGVPKTITSDRGPPPQGCPSLTRRRGDLVRGVTFFAPRTLSTAKGRHWSFPG